MTGGQIVTEFKNFTPALAVLAAVLRVIPTLVVSGKARKRGRNPSHATIRVRTLNSTPPWDKYKEPWPTDWENDETKCQYRKRERVWIKTFLVVFLILAAIYGGLFVDDVATDLIPSREGTGLLALPACMLFLLLSAFQIRFLWKIRGTHGLAPTLYGADGSVTVAGDLSDIRQYCLGALYESGSNIVSCVDQPDPTGAESVEITAATGIWPPQWLNTGPLQLVSFRGQQVKVRLKRAGDDKWDISVRSDNMDPGVDEGHRANRRNARSFVEAWTFFPGSAENQET